jgi:hypothetical protein
VFGFASSFFLLLLLRWNGFLLLPALEILFLLLSAEDNKKESISIDAGSFC